MKYCPICYRNFDKKHQMSRIKNTYGKSIRTGFCTPCMGLIKRKATREEWEDYFKKNPPNATPE